MEFHVFSLWGFSELGMLKLTRLSVHRGKWQYHVGDWRVIRLVVRWWISCQRKKREKVYRTFKSGGNSRTRNHFALGSFFFIPQRNCRATTITNRTNWNWLKEMGSMLMVFCWLLDSFFLESIQNDKMKNWIHKRNRIRKENESDWNHTKFTSAHKWLDTESRKISFCVQMMLERFFSVFVFFSYSIQQHSSFPDS